MKNTINSLFDIFNQLAPEIKEILAAESEVWKIIAEASGKHEVSDRSNE
ncbi:MAG: hypothetical protein HUJ75_06595 [Parasporobacterium sp.]|nr:hypothetical protein [Parasporobacterium sp.]